MQVLPFTSDPAQDFTVQLGEAKYTVEARYNDRSASWVFDLTRDSDQVLLIAGVPLLIGQNMLAPYALHIGGLVATDLSSADVDAGPDDLGERVIVTWLSEEELVFLGLQGAQGSIGVDEGSPGGGTGGGGGTGTGGGGVTVPFADGIMHSDNSGNEVIATQFMADLTPNGAATITLNLAFLATSQAGTATFKAYVGGTPGVIDGTLVGSTTRLGVGPAPKTINGTIANPGGNVPVKVTMKSSAPTFDCSIDDLTGTLG